MDLKILIFQDNIVEHKQHDNLFFGSLKANNPEDVSVIPS